MLDSEPSGKWERREKRARTELDAETEIQKIAEALKVGLTRQKEKHERDETKDAPDLQWDYIAVDTLSLASSISLA